MFVKAVNGIVVRFPYYLEDLKQEFPNTSFPVDTTLEILSQYSIYPVDTTTPVFNELTQIAVQEGCIFNVEKGSWETAWVIRQKTVEELEQQKQELINNIVRGTQQRLDSFAKTRNYDGILSACTYATSTVPKFQNEGQYCVEARDATWAKLYQILDEVNLGVRSAPSNYYEVEKELPILQWPT